MTMQTQGSGKSSKRGAAPPPVAPAVRREETALDDDLVVPDELVCPIFADADPEVLVKDVGKIRVMRLETRGPHKGAREEVDWDQILNDPDNEDIPEDFELDPATTTEVMLRRVLPVGTYMVEPLSKRSGRVMKGGRKLVVRAVEGSGRDEPDEPDEPEDDEEEQQERALRAQNAMRLASAAAFVPPPAPRSEPGLSEKLVNQIVEKAVGQMGAQAGPPPGYIDEAVRVLREQNAELQKQLTAAQDQKTADLRAAQKREDEEVSRLEDALVATVKEHEKKLAEATEEWRLEKKKLVKDHEEQEQTWKSERKGMVREFDDREAEFKALLRKMETEHGDLVRKLQTDHDDAVRKLKRDIDAARDEERDKAKKDARDAESDRSKLAEELGKVRAKLVEEREDLARKLREARDKGDDASRKARDEYYDLKRDLAELKAQREADRVEMTRLKKDHDKLEKELEEAEQELEDAEEELKSVGQKEQVGLTDPPGDGWIAWAAKNATKLAEAIPAILPIIFRDNPEVAAQVAAQVAASSAPATPAASATEPVDVDAETAGEVVDNEPAPPPPRQTRTRVKPAPAPEPVPEPTASAAAEESNDDGDEEEGDEGADPDGADDEADAAGQDDGAGDESDDEGSDEADEGDDDAEEGDEEADDAQEPAAVG